jgi:hypothetical protein
MLPDSKIRIFSPSYNVSLVSYTALYSFRSLGSLTSNVSVIAGILPLGLISRNQGSFWILVEMFRCSTLYGRPSSSRAIEILMPFGVLSVYSVILGLLESAMVGAGAMDWTWLTCCFSRDTTDINDNSTIKVFGFVSDEMQKIYSRFPSDLPTAVWICKSAV